jgi:predicted dithiol-disulfide oxidoreductase (DUF899 family)
VVHEFVNKTYRETNLTGDSTEYLAKREELRLAEVELMKQNERVAALRRELPLGVALPEYQFIEGVASLDADDETFHFVTLSELFTSPDRPLVIYHLMFGKKQTTPCPMCTMWTDGFNGVAQHIAQSMDFAVVAAAEPKALRDHARTRGWKNLRLLSAGAGTFKLDLGSEDAEGGQDSAVSVFTQDADGSVRHFYTAHPRMSPDIKERGTDLLSPVWHLMDLLPHGRGQWYPSLVY